jgi:cyclopropane fatty-acyl-phospholipid synthase-like methyltransferase
MNCRFCKTQLKYIFVDLENAPASNSYLSKEQLEQREIYYPLKVYICSRCKLVQLDEYKKSQDIFDKDYAYFSSFSTSWLEHSKDYTNMIIDKLSLDKSSIVCEIACNDGYLLQYLKKRNIPCFGIEPTQSTSKVAKDKGIEVIEEFFTSDLAKQLEKVDLIIGNNVLSNIPNINDFILGLKYLLKQNATITMEFTHILNIIKYKQFDTIYHEHFSYFSIYALLQIFSTHKLKIYHIEKLSTHGGSLRIYATHLENQNITIENSVNTVLEEEKEFGLSNMNIYENFQIKIDKIKNDLLQFLIIQKINNKKVIAYGAAAKGNTFLNYAGVKKDLIKFVVDKSPYKQGKYLPSSHIPIVDEKSIMEYKPDYILILPWNIKDEIINQLAYVRKWHCKFVVAISSLEIID